MSRTAEHRERRSYSVLRLNGRAFAVASKMETKLGPQALRAWDVTDVIDDDVDEVGLDVIDVWKPALLGAVVAADCIRDPRDGFRYAAVDPVEIRVIVSSPPPST